VLTRLIQLSRSYRGLSALETDEAVKAAKAWDVFGLSEIPEEALPECFKIAMERLEEGYVFGGPNVREVWKELEAERKRAQASSRYCSLCEELEGLVQDETCAGYRCCSCSGGRAKAAAIWGPREETKGRRARR